MRRRIVCCSRRPRIAAILLAAGLLCAGVLALDTTQAFADRLDTDLQPFQATAFDDTIDESAAVEPEDTASTTPAEPEAAAASADQATVAAEDPATEPADPSDSADSDAADEPEAVADADAADAPDAELAAETDAQEGDTVVEVDLPPDRDIVAYGDLPDPQPPQLLWRFKTLFDGTGNFPDPIEELEEHLSHIPLVRTARVERHIRYFQTSRRDHFDQWLTRLNHYKPLVDKIFAQFQLPADLVFLSLVESGFNPKAYSRARAAGPWQFMKATGKIYGLRVDDYVDERRDPIKSTVAAARYLRDLYDLFGTWPLAMAAYNAGERKIQRALRKAHAESFWEIAQTKFIKRETREYVPRFMAAAIIAKSPDQYGFETAATDVHQFEEVIVSRPLHLKAIAAAADLSYEELRRLNPELRRDATPPDDRAYHLKVPVGSRATVEPAVASLKTWTPTPIVARAPSGARRAGDVKPGWYQVKMGDSLSTIAKRFRLTVDELKTRNKLSGRSIKVGQMLLVGR
jgi:membrane-bound lytic murein transglycosylase D